MPELQIKLLGQFQILVNSQPVTNFTSDKVRGLLSYLAAEANFPNRREILADLLWPEKPDQTARASLRRALADLRQVIQDHEADPPFLFISRQDIQFNIDSHAWVDVHQLNRIFELENTSEDIMEYETILQVYQGEFLAGFSIPGCVFFDEWLLLMREQLARKAATALATASTYYEGAGDVSRALPYAWKLVEMEPWRESARRTLMRLLTSSGRRDEAVQQYQDLEKALKNELDIEPESQTRELIEQIKSSERIWFSRQTKDAEKTDAGLPPFLAKSHFVQPATSETFVGRKPEINRMHHVLEDVLDGNGRVLFVAGEAGSGKTMLIREFVQQAQVRHGSLVSATGYCNFFTGSGDPYLPFREVLSQLSGDIENHWKAGLFTRDYAQRLWGTIPSTFNALMKYGGDLVGTILPIPVLMEAAALISAADTDLYDAFHGFLDKRHTQTGGIPSQHNLLSQFGAVLQEVARQMPLVLVLDDLHWADTGTINMLFYLVKHLTRSRVLILGAYRPEEVLIQNNDQRHPLVPILSEFQRDYGDITINLDQSSHRDFVEELLASEPNDFDQVFQESIFRHTRGHALFTVELLRGFQESGTIVRDARGRWVTKSEMTITSLPPKVEGIIGERISRLPALLQRILTIASIEGEVFTAEIIAGIEKIPVSQVVHLLSDQLGKQHRLVQAQEISVVNGKTISTYRFRHILFQKYIYSRLDEIEITDYHSRVGAEMEVLAEEDLQNYAVHLARHFHKSKHIDKSVRYNTMAGTRATQMSAFPEAINHFEQALSDLLTLAESSARDEQELGLQLQLGLAYQSILGYGHENVGKAFNRAWELCQSVGDPTKIITTLQLQFSYFANVAEFDLAKEVKDLESKIVGELEGDTSEFILSLHWGYGYLDSIFGRHKECVANFEKALTCYNQELHQSFSDRLGMDAGVFCNSWASLHNVWFGYPERAQTYLQAALRIAEWNQTKAVKAICSIFSAWISLELWELEAAWGYTDTALKICVEEQYFFYEAVSRSFLGRLLARQGKHQEAIESILRGLEMFRMTGSVTMETTFLQALAEAYYAAGQVQEGLDMIRQAEEFEQKTGEARHKPALKTLEGDFYLLDGNEAAAEKSYLNAVAIAQEQRAKLLELESVKRLARLWHRQGKTKQAYRQLAEIFDWFTEGFETPILVEAKEFLDNLKQV